MIIEIWEWSQTREYGIGFGDIKNDALGKKYLQGSKAKLSLKDSINKALKTSTSSSC